MKEGKLMKKKWKRVNLGSLLNRISNGISVKQQSELREGYLPVSRIETIAKGVIDLNRVKYIEATPEVVEKYLLRSGDILLSHINSDKHLGKVAIVEDGIELLHGINLLLLRCNDDVFPKFLFYQLWLIRLTGGFIDIAQRSVNQSSVNQKKVKAIEVIVPSIADQKMVTYKLDSFFEKHRTLTTSLTRLPALLADFREAVLRKAFRNFKDNKVFLKNLLLEKPKNGIYKPKSFYGRGTKIVRIDKFYDGELKGTWDDMQRVEITSKELSQFGLKNDEILINRVNSMTHLGKCLLIDGLVDECVF
jgi:type I restriction enzyme S subunit